MCISAVPVFTHQSSRHVIFVTETHVIFVTETHVIFVTETQRMRQIRKQILVSQHQKVCSILLWYHIQTTFVPGLLCTKIFVNIDEFMVGNALRFLLG